MSNLEKVFNLFLLEDRFRPVLSKPFYIENKVVATDLHSLVYVGYNDLDFNFINEFQNEAPNCEVILNSENNVDIILDINDSIFEKFKTENEIKYIGEDIECGACGGSGEVEWNFEDYHSYFECPKCQGSGFESMSEKIKTDELTFSDDSYVMLGETYFKIGLFYKLIKVQNLIGGEIKLISQLKDKAHLFEIGNCKIFLMPSIVNFYRFNKDDVLRIDI